MIMISLQMMCLNEHNERFYQLVGCKMEEESQKSHEDYLQGNGKLKNELCRNYLQFGFCRYNSKCQFAHGVDELRQNHSHNMRYKTKLCQSFFQKGCCQYGERCNFLHKEESQEDHQDYEKWRKIKTNFREILEQGRLKSRFFPL